MTGPPTDLDARLQRARSIDWRFALPDPAPPSVATIGRVPDEMAVAMADAGWHQATSDAALALTVDPDAAALRAALSALRADGALCVIWRRQGSPLRRRRLAARSGTAGRLRTNGFDVRWHVFVPSAAETSAILPLSTPQPLDLLLRRRSGVTGSRAARLVAETLRRLGLLARLAPAVLLVARRPSSDAGPAPHQAMDAISGHLAELHRDDPTLEIPDRHGAPLLLTPRFRASRHVVALVPQPERRGGTNANGEPALVIKVARVADGGEVARREASALEALAARPAQGRGAAPSLVHVGSPWGLATIVETAVSGSPLDPATVRRDPELAIATVSDWLVRMVAPVEGRGSGAAGRSTDERIQRLLDEPMASFRATWSGESEERLIEATNAAAAAVRAASLPIAFEHGDASHPNLLRRPDGTLGAVDWELAEPTGLPLHDLTTFLAYVTVVRARTAAQVDQGHQIAASLIAADGWAARALAAHAERIGVEPGCIRPLVVISLARLTIGLAERLEDARSRPPSSQTVDWLRQHRYHVAWRSVALAAADR